MSASKARARRKLRRQVQQEIKVHKYRPTAVVFIFNDKGELLIVHSTVNGNSGVVQGGIYRGEDPQAGAFREMRQEVGIRFRKRGKSIRGPFLVRRMKTPYPKDYSEGKIYWCYRVDVRGTPKIVLQKKELDGARWYSPNAAELHIFLRAQPWYKKGFLLEAIHRASTLH